MTNGPRIARALAHLLDGERATDVADHLAYDDAGHGYDVFGMNPEFVGLGEAIGSLMYDRWFRVTPYDTHHIPTEGAAILAANHSGSLPFDAMMLWTTVVRNTNPPRPPRSVADYFVSSLPFVSTLFARAGVIGGSRGNVRRLLDQGELLMLFPEGTPGIGKPFKERYHLQTWRKGHCEMALRYQAPVVPVGIVGAEEQMPQLGRIPTRKLGMSIPFVPVPSTPIPLPVHYHIVFGEPLHFEREYGPEAADDPQIVSACADRVKLAVQALLHRGLRERTGIFA